MSVFREFQPIGEEGVGVDGLKTNVRRYIVSWNLRKIVGMLYILVFAMKEKESLQ